MSAIIFVLVFGFDMENNNQQETVGFIILGDIHEPGWNGSHYNGIKAACDELEVKLLVRDNVKENCGQCPAAVEELIAQGASIIILASFDYPVEVRPLMDKYPTVSFVDISAQISSKNLTSCFARMYQGRYLAGALAGMKTKTNVIGYVAAIPNSEVCRGINSFALGAQRANPKAKVVVMWTGNWEDEEKEKINANRLIKEVNADVMTYHQDDATVCDVADSFGVDFIGYNAQLDGYSEHHLTSIICRWDIFYKDIIQRYLRGELSSVRNNWIGIKEGVIMLSDFSPTVTADMKTKLYALENELRYNEKIFSEEIYDNQDGLRCGKGEAICDDELLKNINWLIRGVEVLE